MSWFSNKSNPTGFRRMLFGEKMPDKNDPKYKQRYENEVAAGRKAARLLRIDKAAGCVQRFACLHPRWFLGIVMGIILGCLVLNVTRIATVMRMQDKQEQRMTATEHQEQILKQKHISDDN